MDTRNKSYTFSGSTDVEEQQQLAKELITEQLLVNRTGRQREQDKLNENVIVHLLQADGYDRLKHLFQTQDDAVRGRLSLAEHVGWLNAAKWLKVPGYEHLT